MKLALLLGAGACTVPVPGDTDDVFIEPPPPDARSVLGGITNTQPYFGRARRADDAGEVGDFLLASCGCGDWRVLMTPDDGSPQVQLRVLFYTAGEYTPTGSVDVYGQEGEAMIGGTLDQDTGALDARLQQQIARMRVSAQRGVQHSDSAKACVMCHVGDQPIWPQPPNHPAFQTDPPDCLTCHSVNGTGGVSTN